MLALRAKTEAGWILVPAPIQRKTKDLNLPHIRGFSNNRTDTIHPNTIVAEQGIDSGFTSPEGHE